MKGFAAGAVLLAVLSTVRCGPDPIATDTGYVGTWARGHAAARSEISIARVGDDYRFRWRKLAGEGRNRVDCDWSGACVESLDGKKVAEYRFSVRVNPENGRLSVEGDENRTFPTDFKQHYIDELVVTDGGLVLTSFTVERDGEKFEFGKGPSRSFDKVSDAIASPPKM